MSRQSPGHSWPLPTVLPAALTHPAASRRYFRTSLTDRFAEPGVLLIGPPQGSFYEQLRL
ncbi:protein of unknown function [Methanoculleus bourgensis]|uniref:Uncharacterized protein n=1 Tax=Methanoculleus bourgensis TaxID=83986 RepID=A0A0X3BMV3_9EURY|nr:protein of unknown function [Methanoculleus bourgensis]